MRLIDAIAVALASNPAWYENARKASHANGPRLAAQMWARAKDIVDARPAPRRRTKKGGA